MRFFWVAIIALFLPALADARELKPGEGRIVWSFVVSPEYRGYRDPYFPGHHHYLFRFQSADGKHSDYASYNRGGFGPGTDLEEGTQLIGVRSLIVPAGEWVLKHYSAQRGYIQYYPKEVDIPFSVKPGETVYIGSYRVLRKFGKNIFGDAAYAGFFFEVSDQHERDLAVARKKDAAIADADTRLPDVDALRLPDFGTIVPPEMLVDPLK